LKIIVNAVGYVGQEGGAGGAGVFIQYLIRELGRLHSVDVLVAPNSRNFHGQHRNARFIELPHLTAETLRHLRDGPTAVIDPFGALPCAPFPEDIALCVVVHDLMHLERPHFFTMSERHGRSICFTGGLQRADAVVTFSADQARATRRFFPGTNPLVIPHLPYAALVDDPIAGADADTSAYEPFLLLPAVKWPHKNHRTVIAAFGAYVKKTGSSLRLVLCGGPCAETRFSFYPAKELLSEQIVDLGYIAGAKVRALFGAAAAVLFPTLYEGFGIPVLEAAYLGKLILASRLDVFDEILGRQGYRAIEDPLCHLRWMEAFAEVDAAQRLNAEPAIHPVRKDVDPAKFIGHFNDLLKGVAERYTHPGLYPMRSFPAGDRPTSAVVTTLNFHDIYGVAIEEHGARHAVLGPKSVVQSSWIFRSSDTQGDRKLCLRGQYDVRTGSAAADGSLFFSCWVRLLAERQMDALVWSANDGNNVDLLPELRDNQWHYVRWRIPSAGFIDFRGVRDGVSEAIGFDIELHDPCIVRLEPMAIPEGEPLGKRLDIYVAALEERSPLEAVIEAARSVNDALPLAGVRLQWTIITTAAAAADVAASSLPSNVRFQIAELEPFSRANAASLISPYHAIDQLLLLEAEDVARCLEKDNLKVIRAALGAAIGAMRSLSIDRLGAGFWTHDERGQVLSVGHRIGQPIPFLDPAVIQACLATKVTQARPRFAMIETDLTGNIGHHSVVTSLFLSGAEQNGFQPVLGLNREATPGAEENMEFWKGFSTQVYSRGDADEFAEELTEFVKAFKLGPDDLVFMHSLSPQIVLGTARFVAAHAAESPRFAMRFFSTAEAMAGHKLSYTRILRSIESMKLVRRKMHFFCESENLISYYEQAVGRRYPLLLNPEHPSLALMRNSAWFDAGLGGGRQPTLTYFGEARAEKGFDFVPGILQELLADPTMNAFHFIIQTGSNRGNQTPAMTQAKSALAALKKSHPDRIRTFESAETPEEFYFLMKHASGVIAPYRSDAYGIRGSGVTLEALQMGLEVYVWEDTDLYATFRHTGHMIGVPKGESFAHAIARRQKQAATESVRDVTGLRQSPAQVCERLLTLCAPSGSTRDVPPVLWVGNDTFGEGCSVVYASQKRALKELGLDYLELFVPWPNRSQRGVAPGIYDEKVYGFDSEYDCTGLAWIARPDFNLELSHILDSIEKSGPTYARLRDLNTHMVAPDSLRRAVRSYPAMRTILNYTHLYPVIAEIVPSGSIICETHDIISYQHAVRRGGPISLTEKIDEFSDLGRFSQIVAISADEQREMESACTSSHVFWRLPPYLPEQPATPRAIQPAAAEPWPGQFDVPDAIAHPTPAMLATYYTRPDLRQAFGLATPQGRMAFFRWWVFIGQFGSGRRFEFSRAQYEWLVGAVDGGETKASLTGLLQLMLSWRGDLRTAFAPGGVVNVAGLKVWAERNAARELGFSADALLTQSKWTSISGDPPDSPKDMSALHAVVDAAPMDIPGTPGEVEAFFQQIAEIGTIDLVLVGSGHPGNIQSFLWFINQVFLPHIAPTGLSLFIVGSACKQLDSKLHRNLVLVGRCERIEPMLRASRCCPLPVIAGSGSPIKTIPALAVNGAVTVTERVERAFGLDAYGIPSFSDPKAFADDLKGLVTDIDRREDRVRRARLCVDEILTMESYVEFWRQRIGADPHPAI